MPYSPELNLIELALRMIKTYFKKFWLQEATKGVDHNCGQLIEKALYSVDDPKFQSIFRLGLLKWKCLSYQQALSHDVKSWEIESGF